MKEDFSQEEALAHVFEIVSVSVHGKLLYDKVSVYKSRHQAGKLGNRAIENLLKEFGFQKLELWRKKN